MPHIKSIRLANVHFNNATQFYDDFMMEFAGKNATYDLENGGGKSLLLLMLLQTVLPKSCLRREKPVSLLFQGGKERTSHVAVEWILEEDRPYKYLLTGFCARKKRGSADAASDSAAGQPGSGEAEEDENLQSGDIEHLNWCVFYNDHKVTGIQSAPLVRDESGKKVFAGFEDIRKYIQQMRQKGLPAEVFDRIDKYQSYIGASNLIPAEWNIIRGINTGENSIESYFRQNATSRKLIENQFIRIIEDVEAFNRGGKTNDESLLLADTLIEIRSRLIEYQKLKGHMAEYEKIRGYYGEFAAKNEELLSAFSDFEAFKAKAAGIRNRINTNLRELEERKTGILERIANNRALCEEGILRQKKLEAGLVLHGMNRLQAERDAAGEERERLAESYAGCESRYFEAKTLEGYGTYRRIRERLNEAEQSLKALECEGDDLNGQYRKAGGELKYLLERELNENRPALDRLSEAIKLSDEKVSRAGELIIAKEKHISTLQAEEKRLEKDEKAIGESLDGINAYFLAKGEMNALIDPKEHLAGTREQIAGFEDQLKQSAEQIKRIDDEVHALNIRAEVLKTDIKAAENDKKRDEDWLKSYESELSEHLKNAAGFGKDSVEAYREELTSIIHRENMNKLELEIESGRLKQKKRLSEERGYYVPNEDIAALAGKLSGKCEYVKEGVDYISELEPGEKDILLREMPFLPFSVIVDGKSFKKLAGERIRMDFNSDYPVPVVNMETVRDGKNSSKADIFYYCGFADLILDRECYIRYIESMDARIAAIADAVSSSEERIRELNTALSKLTAFIGNYSHAKVAEAADRVRALETKMQSLKDSLANCKKEKAKLAERRSEIENSVREYGELISSFREKAGKLEDCIRQGEAQARIRRELSTLRKEIESVAKDLTGLKAEAADMKNRGERMRDERDNLRDRVRDLEKESEDVSTFSKETCDEPIDAVRGRYAALKARLSGRSVDEERLRRDIEDYGKELEDLQERIKSEYGGDLKQLAKGEESGSHILIPTKEFVRNAKKEMTEAADALKNADKIIAELEKKISGAEGELKTILAGLPEVDRSELPEYESVGRYNEEVRRAQLLIKGYEAEIKEYGKQLESIDDEIRKNEMQAGYYDHFIQAEEVADTGLVAPEAVEFGVYEAEFNNMKKAIASLSAGWSDRIRAVRKEAESFVIREPLEELAGISPPETALQCRGRRDSFREYIMNIEEQMQKINNDILQLESYQQDFTRRCVQRADLVLGHLRKLESLSRIDVYGRRVNMIELRLPEFEEKEKYLRMKAHIDGIIREIGEEGAVDRKIVAMRLSTKELIAQIADMDKAAVRLYKVESIPENCRFYKWENAIGSEGQNNSLYFIFAACLISFIRMLTITNTSLKTKKVIIADNPFGATSAVYLWDPMFRIMKQNDIQLIAPGHRIPREITSRFGVSYLLNQEILQDGRIRVVVKDVRVEEDEEYLKYVNPEQFSMF